MSANGVATEWERRIALAPDLFSLEALYYEAIAKGVHEHPPVAAAFDRRDRELVLAG